MIGCKDSQPPGQSPLIQDLFAMLFRVDIAMATMEITPSEYMKKEISRVGLKLDCSAFYLHRLINYHKMIGSRFRVQGSGLTTFEPMNLER